MKCPFCNHLHDKVVDSRESKEGDAIRRRRECLDTREKKEPDDCRTFNRLDPASWADAPARQFGCFGLRTLCW
jgi:hypothetical protein